MGSSEVGQRSGWTERKLTITGPPDKLSWAHEIATQYIRENAGEAVKAPPWRDALAPPAAAPAPSQQPLQEHCGAAWGWPWQQWSYPTVESFVCWHYGQPSPDWSQWWDEASHAQAAQQAPQPCQAEQPAQDARPSQAQGQAKPSQAPQPKPVPSAAPRVDHGASDDVEVLSDDASAQSDGSEYHGPCSWRRQAPAPKAASKAMPRSAPPAPKAIVPLRRRSPPRAASCAAPPSGSKRCASPCCAPQPPCSRGRCVERTWSKLRLPRRGRVYSTGAFGYDPADRNFEAKFYAKFVEWHPTINPAFGLCFRIPFNFIRCHVSGVFGVVFWEWQRFLF